jgi:hypothetical protein
MVIVTPTIVDPLANPVTPELPKTPYEPLDPGKFDKKTGDKPNGSKQ